MDVARLILDYLKTLVWPVVVVCVLFGFSTEIKRVFPDRVTAGKFGPSGVELTFGTAKERPEAPTEKRAPDIFFGFADVSAAQTKCLEIANAALGETGFRQIAISKTNDFYYGYDEQRVGFIGCGISGITQGLALIMVAGPYDGLAAKRDELLNAFIKRKG